MKKLMAIFLTAVLALSLSSCGKKDKDTGEVAPNIDGYVAEDFMAMQPIINTLGIYHTKFQGEYNSQDSKSFWTLLYILVNTSGAGVSDILLTSNGYEVPTPVLVEFASALFLDYDGLLAIPAGSTIKYAADKDMYYIPYSGPWEVDSIFNTEQENKTFRLISKLYDIKDGLENPQIISQYTIEIVANPQAKKIENPFFKFSVKSVEFQ